MDAAKVIDASRAYPKPPAFTPAYGTAGFRAAADLLPSTVFRCGLLMAARALKTRQVTGICVTASHNPAADNGVKLVEPSGEMLVAAWEAHADALARAETDAALAERLAALLEAEGLGAGAGDAPPVVLLARDTRPSGAGLVAAAAAGVAALGGRAEDCGVLTTPLLHWRVWRRNSGLPDGEADYCATLAAGFARLVAGTPAPPGPLHVDCANGVGARALAALAPHLEPAGLALRLHATGDGVLNGGCGSDHLQKSRTPPAEFAGVPPGARCCALDGDADRIMFFSPGPSPSAECALLLDGDRIAALAAALLTDLLAALPPGVVAADGGPPLGIVQTAYANGAAAAYARSLGCGLAVTPTGVKHLHAAAHAFQAGVYFEANGHGTVLLRPDLLERARAAAAAGSEAAADLLALADAVNQAVGDAISGLLLVEAALRRRGWGLPEWAALYADLPSKQMVVKVADRSVVTTTHAETRASAPAGLQAAVDAAVAAADPAHGRAFVRPSGTEDVVRVYAEAGTRAAADALALAVARAVHALAGGVGPAP